MNYYPTNLYDSQWMLLEGILNKNTHLLDIFNAIFYFLKTGWGNNKVCFQSVPKGNCFITILSSGRTLLL
jgi:hypothetical protein